MADQRIIYTEEMVGAGHPTKADTINRLALVEHNNDGTHKYYGTYDVKRFGAKGDGSTDDTVAIQSAIDAANAAGGGWVVVPPTSAFYKTTNWLYGRSNVEVMGFGYGSFIKNIGASGETAIVFNLGGYRASTGKSFTDETFYNCSNTAIGDTQVTCTTASQAGSFATGDLIFLRSSAYHTDYASHTVPHYCEINEVVSANATTGVIVLKYQLQDPYVGLSVAKSSGTLTDTRGNAIAPIKRFGLSNLRIEQGTNSWQAIAGGGAFECYMRNLWLSDVCGGVVINGLSHSFIKNIWCNFDNKIFDIAYWSSHVSMRGIKGSRKKTHTFSESPIILGESIKHYVLDDFDVYNGDSVNSAFALSMGSEDGRVCNGRVVSPSSTAVVSIGQGYLNDARNITLQNVTIPCSASNAAGVRIKTTNPGNKILNNTITGTPINGGIELIASWATGNTIKGNYIPDSKILNSSGVTTNLIANNITKISQTPLSNSTFSSHTGTVTETTMRTYAIPAGSVGKKNQWRIRCGGNVTGTNGTKDIKLKVGGTIFFTVAYLTADTGKWFIDALLSMNGTLAGQLMTIYSGKKSLADAVEVGSATIDTAINALDITLTFTLGNTSDTITLTNWFVEPLGDQFTV